MQIQNRLAAALLLLFVIGASREASAGAILVGSRIDLSPTTFALPIDIVDGIDVESWQFNLTYDASDVQVNTGCDPFAGDIYCSLLTGPVTEGDFFASGAPFNLLIPGFVDLDPLTLAQTGLLFGVSGTFGGSPFPSGNGTLAFVEFTRIGDGNSVINVDSSLTPVPVPEPATLTLCAFGSVLLGVQRRLRRSHKR